MVPWTVEEKALRKAKKIHLRKSKGVEEEAKQKKRKKKVELPEPEPLEETQPPAKRESPPAPEARPGEVGSCAGLDPGTEEPPPILGPQSDVRVIQDDYSDLNFDRDTSGAPPTLGVLDTKRRINRGWEKPPGHVPSPPRKRPRPRSPEILYASSKRMKQEYDEDLGFDTQGTGNDARSIPGRIRETSSKSLGKRRERTSQPVKAEAPRPKPKSSVQHDPRTLRFSGPMGEPLPVASRMSVTPSIQTWDPLGSRGRRVRPAEESMSQESVSRSFEVRISKSGTSSKRKRQSVVADSSLPPSSANAQPSYSYDDLPAVISAYQPTPKPPYEDPSAILPARHPAPAPSQSQTPRKSCRRKQSHTPRSSRRNRPHNKPLSPVPCDLSSSPSFAQALPPPPLSPC